MTLFVLFISLIILGFGAVGILAPLRLINFVIGFDNLRGLYVEAAFRIIFGLALIYIAKATQWPEFLHILGLFTIAAGFGFMLFGGVWFLARWSGEQVKIHKKRYSLQRNFEPRQILFKLLPGGLSLAR